MGTWNNYTIMNTVISQALATGLPVITTFHSGLPEQVVDGKNGFLVPESDYMALADKIQYLIDNPQLWAEFGRYGRMHVTQFYNSEILIKQQIECYIELVSQSAKSERGN